MSIQLLAPIRRQTLTQQTTSAIREQILRGHIPDGEPLRQDAIADELGVSRIPVREALRQLEAEGLVTFNPHRGAVVSTLSLAEIAELFEVRAETESGLLHRAVPQMTKEDDRRAGEVLDQYEAALEKRELTAWGALNWQFHSTLYAPANRPLTLGIVSKLHQQSDRYLRMQLSLTHGESRAAFEHRAIATAARKRDVARAVTLLHDHIVSAGRSLVAFLTQQRIGEGASTKGKRIAK